MPDQDLRDAAEARHIVRDVWGDCCSESWWADAIGVKQLLGSAIRDIEEIDMPVPEDVNLRTRQEEDQVYGVRVRTSNGVCDLAFRNSSNGYYGGECEFRWEEPEAASSLDGFRQITTDWSA